ncbi:MAG: winged helix-turn-helix transcriptional regulator [Pirellulales bacterium]|nr:winged helix-turn-helix transcriptional regulator [Pirellulales bacterium]
MMASKDERIEIQPARRWEDEANQLRIIAHPVRLAILAKLCERPHCVKHLNALIAIPQPHLSQHIAALRRAKLVACHACGTVRCYYLLKPTLVESLIRLLCEQHPAKERDCHTVVRDARKGWEERLGRELESG